MTTSSFWNFISAAEDEYSVYRKRIMAKFSLSAAETDIIMFLANNPGYARRRIFQRSAVY